jgi:hypothetical protein
MVAPKNQYFVVIELEYSGYKILVFLIYIRRVCYKRGVKCSGDAGEREHH